MSLVLHWVACAIAPVDDDPPGLGYTRTKAFEEGAVFARKLFDSDKDDLTYDASYIKKRWYEKANVLMKSPIRGTFDDDSPY